METIVRKTKLEIIDETVAFYSKDPINRRSVNEDHRCMYKGPDGKRCAFSRCCDENKIDGLVEGKAAPKNPDDFLKEEYHGHSPYFWKLIQTLHDDSYNWTATGLSEYGIQKLLEIGDYKQIDI